jgi:ribosomal protein S18 acetylase RimI-like enzyme
MTSSIRVASPSDMQDIAAVMDRAFRADPTVTWGMTTEQVFLALHHKFVEICAVPAFDRHGVHAFTDFAGAAIWYPPGVEIDGAKVADLFSSGLTPDLTEAFFDLLEACEEYRPGDPYWELEMLAVDPACQGKGLGSTLLDHGLAICDRDRAPVYLESSNPANLSFYRRHGFDLLAEVQLPGTPKRFPMLRSAR